MAAVQGGAGTGKTMLGIEKARRIHENEETKDEKVLFLCFNEFLHNFLKNRYREELPNVSFYSIDKLVKKHFKKILATLLILVVVAFGFVGNYFYNFGLNPKVDKGAIVNQDSDGSKEDKTVLNKWFDETKQTVEMESVTKNKLVGYKFVNPDAKKWVFVVHGYTSDAKKMANYIKNIGQQIFI